MWVVFRWQNIQTTWTINGMMVPITALDNWSIMEQYVDWIHGAICIRHVHPVPLCPSCAAGGVWPSQSGRSPSPSGSSRHQSSASPRCHNPWGTPEEQAEITWIYIIWSSFILVVDRSFPKGTLNRSYISWMPTHHSSSYLKIHSKIQKNELKYASNIHKPEGSESSLDGKMNGYCQPWQSSWNALRCVPFGSRQCTTRVHIHWAWDP